MLTKEEKTAQLHLSLDDKIKQSKRLIMDWYVQFKGNVYVAYSGGKDSTVLLHLVRSLYPDVPAVFCNTGLEYPDIVEFVKTTPNVEIIKPKLTFKQVLEKYGYPVISKEQSQYIYDCRNTKSCKQLNIRLNGNKSGRGCVSNKWKFLIDAPFKISNKCCNIMKKNPSKEYEKRTGRKPYLGIMATESAMRIERYYKGECNAFNSKRPESNPIIFWDNNDIWEYIKRYNVDYCKIYDKGFSRTGCMFCMYGAERDDDDRFYLMKKHYPKIYDYCMEKLNLRYIMDYIKSGGPIKGLFSIIDRGENK
jgi:3'-phosphoadenosine 5'-phosphosulfate sulfotransferase (PAPS reductase)/FAD synthetase